MDDILGWIGVSLMLVAYLLATLNIFSAMGWGYQLMNLAGGVTLLYVFLKKKIWFTVVLEIVWCLIGIIAIIKLLI